MDYVITRNPTSCDVTVFFSAAETEEFFKHVPEEAQVLERIKEASIEPILSREKLTAVSTIVCSEETPKPGQDFFFTFSFDTLPPLQLPSRLEDLTITIPEPALSPSSMHATIDRLRRKHAVITPVTNRKPQSGDTVIVDIEGFHSGEKLAGMHAKNYRLLMNAESDAPEIRNTVLQLMPGETGKTLYVCPENYPNPRLRGKTVELKVHLTGIVREELPTFDDNFARKLGLPSLEVLKKTLTMQLMNQKLRHIRHDAEQRLLKQLLEDQHPPLPRSIVQTFFQEGLQEYRDSMLRQQLSQQQIVAQLKDMENEILKKAREQALAHVFLLAIAEREHIAISEQELYSRLAAIMPIKENTPEETVRHLEEAGNLDDIRERLLAAKTCSHIYQKARKIVVDMQGKPVSPKGHKNVCNHLPRHAEK